MNRIFLAMITFVLGLTWTNLLMAAPTLATNWTVVQKGMSKVIPPVLWTSYLNGMQQVGQTNRDIARSIGQVTLTLDEQGSVFRAKLTLRQLSEESSNRDRKVLVHSFFSQFFGQNKQKAINAINSYMRFSENYQGQDQVPEKTIVIGGKSLTFIMYPTDDFIFIVVH
jgi:hypothetical protein